MRLFVFVLFLLTTNFLFSQLLTESELLKKTLYSTKSEALKNPEEVYRLALSDFDPMKDGTFLKQFVNCQVLDLSVSKNVEIIPLGIKGLVNLQYLNLNGTSAVYIYSYLKGFKNLKVVTTVNASASASDKNKLKKKGIRIIETINEMPGVFSGSTNNSVVPNKNDNLVVNDKYAVTSGNKFISKDINGDIILNPEGVPIDATKSVWSYEKNGVYYMCSKKKLYGIVDQSGNVVQLLPLTIGHIDSYFSEGLIAFMNNTTQKYGYCDRTGNILIQPQFDHALPFKNGRANVKLGELRGFIDKQGKWVVQPQFISWEGFDYSDFAFVKFKGDENYGVIDRVGNILVRNTFTQAEISLSGTMDTPWIVGQVIKTGLILVEENELFGYKNLKGEWVIQPKYKHGNQFRHNLATVSIVENEKTLFGVINPKGETVIPFIHKTLSTAWSNTYESDENVTLAGETKDGDFLIYNDKAEVVFGPIKTFENKKIRQLQPFKYDCAKIELYGTEIIKDKHPSIPSVLTTFINRKGEKQFQETHMIAFNLNRNGLIYYMNYDPQVLGIIYDSPELTDSVNKILENFNHVCGFMNLKGEKVIEMQGRVRSLQYVAYSYTVPHDQLGYSPNSVYFDAQAKDGSVKYISYYGKELKYQPRQHLGQRFLGDFSEIVSFSELIEKTRYLRGYMNIKTGEIIYEKELATQTYFFEGCAAVYPGGYLIEVEKME